MNKVLKLQQQFKMIANCQSPKTPDNNSSNHGFKSALQKRGKSGHRTQTKLENSHSHEFLQQLNRSQMTKLKKNRKNDKINQSTSNLCSETEVKAQIVISREVSGSYFEIASEGMKSSKELRQDFEKLLKRTKVVMEGYSRKLSNAGDAIVQLKSSERALKKKVLKYETKYGKI